MVNGYIYTYRYFDENDIGCPSGSILPETGGGEVECSSFHIRLQDIRLARIGGRWCWRWWTLGTTERYETKIVGVRTRRLKLHKQKNEAVAFGTQHTDREIAEKSPVTRWKTFAIIILATAAEKKKKIVSQADIVNGPATRLQWNVLD